jgi:hypothetical protein
MQRMPSSVVSNMIVLSSQISDRNALLDLFNQRIGSLECLTIIKSHFPVDELNNRIGELTNKFATNQIGNLPLIQIEIDGDIYSIKLARIDKLISGEYINVDELERKMQEENIIALRRDLNRLQETLIENSMNVYASLKTKFKDTNFGKKFDGLMISKKRRYLYFYTNDKKKTLGFIVEKQEQQQS